MIVDSSVENYRDESASYRFYFQNFSGGGHIVQETATYASEDEERSDVVQARKEETVAMIARFRKMVSRSPVGRRGVVTAEYLILLTLVGIGVVVGLAVVRNSLLEELCELAQAISAIITP